MLGDISQAEHIYVACGHTDLRRAIDGLATTIKQSFHLDPFSNSLFLFCGRRREGDGFFDAYEIGYTLLCRYPGKLFRKYNS